MEQLELFSESQLKALQLAGVKIHFEGIKVLKEDGREVPFDVNSIYNTIEKTFRSTVSKDQESELIIISLKIGGFVLDELKESVKNGKKVFTVEEIQDLVERKLYDNDIAIFTIIEKNEHVNAKVLNQLMRRLAG